MKKLAILLAALLLPVSMACAELNLNTGAVTLSLSANMTTGFCWTGFVFSGDSVVLDSAEGTYVMTPTDQPLCGGGGETYFTLIPVQPGRSIVTFTYARSWEPETAHQRVLLADVDEEMNLSVSDVTESGVLEGVVTRVDADSHSVLLETEKHGELAACFDADMQLPAAQERVVIYTDGTMTLSLPAQTEALAWVAVPTEAARAQQE